MKYSARSFTSGFALSLLFALAACGGGGGGGSDDSGSGGGNSKPAQFCSSSPVNEDGDDFDSGGPLQAQAGYNRQVLTGTRVTLDGSLSRNDGGGQITYDWTLVSKPDDSDASLNDREAARPDFTADQNGDYVARLVINGNDDQSEPDRVTITARSGNTRPISNAGRDQNVKTGAQVTLDGRNSGDATGGSLQYRWSLPTKPDGSQASLSQVKTPSPEFTPDTDGRYVAALRVRDGNRACSLRADRVVINADSGNSPPVANAGTDQRVGVGVDATLDGSASSDADDDDLIYTWRVVSQPRDSEAALANPNSAQPSLTPDAKGDYVIELTVSDGVTSGIDDRVVVSAGPFLILSVFDQNAGEEGSGAFRPANNQIINNVTFSSYTPGQTLLDQEIGRFIFSAVGEDFTVSNVSTEVLSTPDNGSVTLEYQGLSSGGTIPANDNKRFSTAVSSLSGSGQYNLLFSFDVEKTNTTYKVFYRLNVPSS